MITYIKNFTKMENSDVTQFFKELEQFDNNSRSFDGFNRYTDKVNAFIEWKKANAYNRLAKALEELPKDFNANIITE